MNILVRTMAAACTAVILITSCNEPSATAEKKEQQPGEQNEAPQKENDGQETQADEQNRRRPQLNDNTDNDVFDCAPKQYNPKILSAPDLKAIHPAWINNEVGTSWSLMSARKITNEAGIFLLGDLVSPKGSKMTKEPVYVIFSEWDCSN